MCRAPGAGTYGRERGRGFTLIELLVAVTILGLLAGVVAIQVKTSMTRAKMNVLKHDLRVMRDLIQQYKVDKKVYPPDLYALVEEGYMRAIPRDPFTDSDQWDEIAVKNSNIRVCST